MIAPIIKVSFVVVWVVYFVVGSFDNSIFVANEKCNPRKIYPQNKIDKRNFKIINQIEVLQ